VEDGIIWEVFGIDPTEECNASHEVGEVEDFASIERQGEAHQGAYGVLWDMLYVPLISC
jgi:hypothetical protein